MNNMVTKKKGKKKKKKNNMNTKIEELLLTPSGPHLFNLINMPKTYTENEQVSFLTKQVKLYPCVKYRK